MIAPGAGAWKNDLRINEDLGVAARHLSSRQCTGNVWERTDAHRENDDCVKLPGTDSACLWLFELAKFGSNSLESYNYMIILVFYWN
jgi:hypothetical protein